MPRTLGIETSSERGSLALVQDGVIVARVHHDAPNEHAERSLSLLAQLLANAGWDKRQLERVAVGVGPGAFTGIRIGIALAHGLALGLGIPTVGVGSLRAIAAAHAKSDARLRLIVRDARREEFFVAAYDGADQEVLAPTVWPRQDLALRLTDWLAGRTAVVLGERVSGFDFEPTHAGGAPDAGEVALLGEALQPALHPPHPNYARGPGADPQNLLPSPLLLPRV